MSKNNDNGNPEQIITDLLNDTIDSENYNIIICCDETATLFDIFMKKDDGSVVGGRYDEDANALETNTFDNIHEVLLATVTNIHDMEAMSKGEDYVDGEDHTEDDEEGHGKGESEHPYTFRYSYVYINKNGDVGDDGILLIFDNKYMNTFKYKTETLYIPVVIVPVQNQQIQFDRVLSKVDPSGIQGNEKTVVESLFSFFRK